MSKTKNQYGICEKLNMIWLVTFYFLKSLNIAVCVDLMNSKCKLTHFEILY